MPTAQLDHPAHWRKRAAETRRAADKTFDRPDKKTLGDIADAYEKLARIAETKARKYRRPSNRVPRLSTAEFQALTRHRS